MDLATLIPADLAAYIMQVVDVVKAIPQVALVTKVMMIVTLLVSSMKVTALKKLVWDKLGKAQLWVGPSLALVGGLAEMAINGNITLLGALTYVAAGAGAPYLHQLLDLVKKIPKLGPMWVKVIDFVQSKLGGK